MTINMNAPGVIDRDRWGRPLIIPPDGGKPVAYTRCTTYVSCLEDRWHLEQWGKRMVAVGIADRPDLALAVAAHRDNKTRLNALCDDAMEAAKAHSAATTGTAIHALTEQSDRGTLFTDSIPVEYRPDVEAYRSETAALTHVDIERLMVCDALAVAGTPDRIVEWRGHRYIADVKTGRIDYGLGTIMMQLAVYANSSGYDPSTGKRADLGVDTDRAIVIHLPAGTGTCDLYWVDIAAGWEGVQLAARVREWRKRRHTKTTMDPHPARLSWSDQIAAASTVDELTSIWSRAFAAGDWTDDLTQAAADRKASFSGGLT